MNLSNIDAWLDFRESTAFQAGHFSNAAQFHWPELQSQLNQLPAPPSSLGLIAQTEEQANQVQCFLQQKSYCVAEKLTIQTFQQLSEQQPGLVITGPSARLWSPTSVLEQWIVHNNIPPGLALDLGCGGGRDAVFLAESGWAVTAIDNQARVLDRAENLAKSRNVKVNWQLADVRTIQSQREQLYDLVLMIRFLNRDLYPYIRDITRPGGYVLIHTFSEGAQRFGSPKQASRIVQLHELAKEFSEFEIIIDKIEPLEDGRPMATLLARKKEIL